MEYKVKLGRITSVRSVLKIAAEIIEHDMRRIRWARGRGGCCLAFNDIHEALWRNGERGSPVKRAKRIELVNEAQHAFEAMFRPANAAGYWMGQQRTNKQQERRIMALLTAAEAV